MNVMSDNSLGEDDDNCSESLHHYHPSRHEEEPEQLGRQTIRVHKICLRTQEKERKWKQGREKDNAGIASVTGKKTRTSLSMELYLCLDFNCICEH